MQRCPYIHEMKERLLGPNYNQPQSNRESYAMDSLERTGLIQDNRQSERDSNQVGTVVKLNPDGYGSHTSPTHQRTPLVPQDLGEDFNIDNDDIVLYDYRRPKNANTESGYYHVQRKKRTSLFIVTSLVYAMILIVVCVAYVISDVSTHKIPVVYYEAFFTYLYGSSILFLLYVFCFLLQESSCCNGSPPKEKKPSKKESKKQKPKKPEPTDAKDSKSGKEAAKAAKPSPFQEKKPIKKRDLVRQSMQYHQDSTVDAEAGGTPKNIRKRKTTINDPSHGSFFLRVGALAFGLGTMIYVGLEIGTFFEIPFDSPCHEILRGVNPLLQMIFTFMQMYFIFMNSRLNIHRFKVLARFGLMHICATNICVWIRTLVLESLKALTGYHMQRRNITESDPILESMRQHSLRHAGTVMGTHKGEDWEYLQPTGNDQSNNHLARMLRSTVKSVADFITQRPNVGEWDDYHSTAKPLPNYHGYDSPGSMKFKKLITSTTAVPSTTTTTTTTLPPPTTSTSFIESTTEYFSTVASSSSANPSTTQESLATAFSTFGSSSSTPEVSSTTPESTVFNNIFSGMENAFQTLSNLAHNDTEATNQNIESLDSIHPAALISNNWGTTNLTSCNRQNIMGTIVEDSSPYLYPVVIEYCLIGAVVIYVMWRHIGKNPRYTNDEDLEHRLEVMLSRRAVARAAVNSDRVDCVGASKGLFFGLLLLVGSLICLILFFVLIRHSEFALLAKYLADASHCAIMGLAVFAIIIGFCRVQSLKFRCEEQTNLNDILLRISAFGLFIYNVFTIIAGALNSIEYKWKSEPSLLVLITGSLAVIQVVFQLLFIADVSRRRVHLPEHDRSKPGRQIVTFLLICNIAMFAIYTFEAQKVFANPVQSDFYGYIAWSLIQRVTLPLCIFHRFHSAVTLAEIWKTTYKARLD